MHVIAPSNGDKTFRIVVSIPFFVPASNPYIQQPDGQAPVNQQPANKGNANGNTGSGSQTGSNGSGNSGSGSSTPSNGCALSPQLSINGQGQSTPNGSELNIRDLPGTGSRAIGKLPNGGVFLVLAGPTCTEGYNWWNIDYQGTLGWIAEGANGTYYVLPTGSPPAQQPQSPPNSNVPNAPSGCIPSNGCMERKSGNTNAWWADEWHLGHCATQSDTDWIVTYNTSDSVWMSADVNKVHFYAPITSLAYWYKAHAQVEDAVLPGITLCMSGHLQETDIQNTWVRIDN